MQLTQIVHNMSVAMNRSVLNVLVLSAIQILTVALDIVVDGGILATKVGVSLLAV